MDLERTIADLVERKDAALVDSPEWTFANNALTALRYSVTGAGWIIDDLDQCRQLIEGGQSLYPMSSIEPLPGVNSRTSR